MKKIIAERGLLYSEKGSDKKYEFKICIGAPFPVVQDDVDFEIGDGLFLL